MRREINLDTLLKHLDPELDSLDYVFTTFNRDTDALPLKEFWALIREREGTTYIVEVKDAEICGIHFDTVYKRITLKVHSSLDAVGLTAAVSHELAVHGISANMVAGYYHDHIFVPADRAAEALEILIRMSERAASKDS